MLKMLLELGVGLIGQVAQGHLAKKAIKTLVKGGMLTKEASQQLARNPKALKEFLRELPNQSPFLGTGVFSDGRLGRAAIKQGHVGWGGSVLRTAQQQMANSRGYGAISKIMFGAGMAWGGFELASGGEKMFEKNIPGGFSEIMQTQQQFLPRQAHTQRQRAIQAIHQSQLSTRSALGNESQFIH